MHHSDIDRYLALLGVARRAPSLDALTEIVRRHLCRVPFENVSKLYRMKTLGLRGLPALDLFLDGIERFGFGGTCYTNNYYLHVLLAELGYRVRLCGADMSSPDVHLVNMVEVDGCDYLVDVGYAAPFREPMSRDQAGDHVIHAGDDRYVLKPPDEDGRSRMELYRAGTLTHRYTAKPEARAIAEFEGVIADSFRETATFMNALLVARFCPDRSLVVRDLRVTEVRGSAPVTRTLANRRHLEREIREGFGIPESIVSDATEGLPSLESASR